MPKAFSLRYVESVYWGEDMSALFKQIFFGFSIFVVLGSIPLHAEMTRERGVYLVHLKGTLEERTREHARLVAPHISQTAIPYYSTLFDRLIARSGKIRRWPILSNIARTVLDKSITYPLRRNMTSEVKEALRIYSEGVGLSYDKIQESMLFPDMAQALYNEYYAKPENRPGESFQQLPSLGCTTIATPSTQGWLVARNLDFAGGGPWDAMPAIYWIDPPKPQIPYVSIGTLGMPMGVVTGINQEGIILSLHQIFQKDLDLGGEAILFLTERTLSHAKTLDEATDILMKAKPTSSWRIILSSAKEKRTLVVDVSPSRVHVSELNENRRAITNSPMGSEFETHAFSKDYISYQDSCYRAQSAHESVKNTSEMNLQKVTDAIASREVFDPAQQKWHCRTSGFTVAARNNIQSVVFAPESNLVYIGIADAAMERPLDGTFHAFPLNMDGEGPLLIRKLPRKLVANTRLSPDSRKAMGLYRTANGKVTEYGAYLEGRQLLDQAMALDATDPIFPLMAGLTTLNLAYEESGSAGKEKWLAEAISLFEKANSIQPIEYYRSLTYLFIARAYDLLDRDSEARYYRGQVVRGISPLLDKALIYDLNGDFGWNDIPYITVDFGAGDVSGFY